MFYVYPDQVGRPWVITNAFDQLRWRWDTSPFGELPPSQNPEGLGTFAFNLRFPGQYHDQETGLFYNMHRTYDPQTGRYLEPDPFLTVNRLVTRDWVFPVPYLLNRPQALHPYTYVANGPLANADPLGLIWPIDCYECFFSKRNKFEEALKECRQEFDRCKNEKEQIEFAERYGGTGISSAIFNCAVQKDPQTYHDFIETCGKCGVAPRGPWPLKPPPR